MRKTLFVSVFIFAFAAACHAGEISLEQVKKVLDKPVSAHPRLFINDSVLADVKSRLASSDDLKALNEQIIAQADSLIDKAPLERKKIGRRLLSVSRKELQRLMTLSWSYRITGREKYLKRAETEMLSIAEFTDWNPSHFLDVAEMTLAMAVGYDWLYNELSEDSRKIIKQAIVEKGLKPSLNGERYNWWIKSNNNWNQVCHGGMTCGVLAVMEDERQLSEEIIHRAVNKVQIAMAEYGPDGVYPEGPGYWVYGTTYNVILLEALDSVLGTDFGLSEMQGFAKSAEYYLHVTGPSGLFFNYADCGSKGGHIPIVSWFANKYDNPSLLWNQKTLFGETKPSRLASSRTSVLSMLWSDKEPPKPSDLSWMGQGENPVAMFRSSWTDKNAAYLAVKGGSPQVNHAHMDVGSFVIESDGVRWAVDLGPESYHRIESMGMSLWNSRQNADRWKLFRYSNFAHNTLAVNEQLQIASGFAPIIRYSGNVQFPHAAVDLTDVYKGQLKKAVRGASLLPTRQILIQDELEAAGEAAVVRWNMVTPADVNIKSNTAAVLTKSDKSLQFEVITDADIKLATYSTKPRSKYDAENPDTRMIGFDVKLKPGEKKTVKVVMTPGNNTMPLKGNITNVEDWSKPIAVASHEE